MSSLWAVILIAYSAGQPAGVEIVPSDSEAECKAGVVAALQELQPQMKSDMQMVAKCVDIGNLPVTGSVFGTRKPSTNL